jgi:hypothetical protein
MQNLLWYHVDGYKLCPEEIKRKDVKPLDELGESNNELSLQIGVRPIFMCRLPRRGYSVEALKILCPLGLIAGQLKWFVLK